MRTSTIVALVWFAAACGKKDDSNTSSKTGAPPTPAVAAPSKVDTCALVPKDKLEATVGKVSSNWAQEMEPGAVLLGTCGAVTDKGHVTVEARPSDQMDGRAKNASNAHPVAGVGQKAVMTESGLLVQPAGTGYFLVVMVEDADHHQDEATATAIAKIAVENAK